MEAFQLTDNIRLQLFSYIDVSYFLKLRNVGPGGYLKAENKEHVVMHHVTSSLGRCSYAS
jgi:hypothetical protein